MIYNRLKLLEKLAKVSPALSESEMIQVMTHFWFTGESLLAYNDHISISVPLKTDFQGAVRGHTLLSLLKASRAKDIEFIYEEGVLHIKAASSRFKLNALEPESFIFEMPEPLAAEPFPVKTKDFLNGIECCMKSVSNDTSVPDQLGITMVQQGDILSLYSTNNSTLSHVQIETDPRTSMKDGTRAILPSEFCSQMLKIAEPDKPLRLEVQDEYCLLTTERGEALFGRLIEVDVPYDFDDVISHHYNDEVKQSMIPIPSKLQLVLARSSVIVDGSIEATAAQVTVADGKAKFYSKSERGEVRDSIQTSGDHPKVSVKLEPKHLMSGYGRFDEIAFTPTCAVMSKENMMFLVAAVGD